MYHTHLDPHAMTVTQLEAAIRELTEEIAHLHHALHDVGVSASRDRALIERRSLLESLSRELDHRQKDRH